MPFASELYHVGVGDVGHCVTPVSAGAGSVVHEVFGAAYFVRVATGVVDCLKKIGKISRWLCFHSFMIGFMILWR